MDPGPSIDEPLDAHRVRLLALREQLATLVGSVERGTGALGFGPTVVVPEDEPPPESIVLRRATPVSAQRIAAARAALARQRSGDPDPLVAPPRAPLTARVRAKVPSRSDIDPVVVCWSINVVCWLVVVAVAMLWGLGFN